jgi:hypothetical protein
VHGRAIFRDVRRTIYGYGRTPSGEVYGVSMSYGCRRRTALAAERASAIVSTCTRELSLWEHEISEHGGCAAGGVSVRGAREYFLMAESESDGLGGGLSFVHAEGVFGVQDLALEVG